jgi:hypothetical protein
VAVTATQNAAAVTVIEANPTIGPNPLAIAQALDIPSRISAAAHGSDGRMSLSQFDRAACTGCNF